MNVFKELGDKRNRLTMKDLPKLTEKEFDEMRKQAKR